MSHKFDYDYFVIGAGSGGVRSARIAASHGAKVGIAEGRFFGGTCVNVGCVPKKLLAYAADYGDHLEDAKGYGWSYDNLSFDWKTLIDNKDKDIARLNEVYKNILKQNHIDAFEDYASFQDSNTLQIGDKTITADKILIACGGKPRMPDIEGVEHMINSDGAFYLDALPDHIVIYGGGYIAVEFAHIFSGLGAKVTLVYRGDLFMRGFDIDIRNHLRDDMMKQGIDLSFNANITHIGQQNEDKIVTLDTGSTIICDTVMAAIGRVPETGKLNLKAANIKTNDSGHIVINDRYQTSVDNIHAIGDVIGKVELTPVAIVEGHWLADCLFGDDEERPTPSYDDIPTAVFSKPNIATIGLTQEKALAEGYEIKVFKSNFKPMIYSLTSREERSLMKIIVDRKTDKLLGIHLIGVDSAEILQGFAVAVKMGMKKSDLDQTIGIHPTVAEELVQMRQEDCAVNPAG